MRACVAITNDTIQLDVSAYRNGTYIVKLFTNDKSIFTKNFTVAR